MTLYKRASLIRNLCVSFIFFLFISFIVDAQTQPLQHNRLGDIIFGEKLATSSLIFQPSGAILEGCQYIKMIAYPGIDVMVVDGIIERLDTSNTQLIKQDSPFYALNTGSMTLASFRKTYPEIEIAPHEYENGFYLRWYNKDQSKAIVVDFINGDIELIKAGLVPTVLLVEGCA
ncbi:hypothetical protein [Paraglaciecola sp. L3A3]|uniref:hypothetical protein n=1 Tax=Paraglaciecola sp. L3A3 TaxID=2686358 RepID=UPI00131CCA68|nr:hypothetical protein [Paraglaciecola sp. L3A3]